MVQMSNKQMFFISALLLFTGSNSYAGGLNFESLLGQQLEGKSLLSTEKLELLDNTFFRSGLNLNNDLDHTFRDLLSDRGLHPYLNLKVVREMNAVTGLSLTTTGGLEPASTRDYQFMAGEYAVCNTTIRVVTHPDGSGVAIGAIPVINHVPDFSDDHWPNHKLASSVVVKKMVELQGINPSQIRFTSTKACLFNEQGELRPVWNFVFLVNGLQYEAQADQTQVYAANQKYFDATATVSAFSPNSKTGTLSTFSVTVNGDGTLTNDYFTTSNAKGSRLSSTTNSFISSSISDSNLAEPSAFAYVNQQYDFAASKGYTWQGPKPLTVEVHSTIGKGGVNNALYTPAADSSGFPKIQVGDGDGIVLQNLPFDYDVVAHEFGHHVVYQSITEINGESLILHEGLADFLTFSKTGDACLGESICPATSSSCVVVGKCLRTAETTMAYNDTTYKAYAGSAHRQGQLISGIMWDLRKNNSIPSDTVTAYTMETIKYLPAAADIKSFVAALLYVDQRNKGTYNATITSALDTRGLSPTTLGIDTTKLDTYVRGGANAPNGTVQTTEEKTKSTNIFGCSASGVTTNAPNAFNLAILFAFIFFPVFMTFTAKKASTALANRRRETLSSMAQNERRTKQ